jgi:hypothetical protein
METDRPPAPATDTREVAAALLAILSDDSAPSLSRVHSVVVELDRALAAEPDAVVLAEALARAVIAVGRPLLAHTRLATVAATLAAAEAFVRVPDEATERRYQECATMSYPYGPGDGCYAIDGHPDPEPDNGCRSGAGTLAQVAYQLGADVVAERLAVELNPWLRELLD